MLRLAASTIRKLRRPRAFPDTLMQVAYGAPPSCTLKHIPPEQTMQKHAQDAAKSMAEMARLYAALGNAANAHQASLSMRNFNYIALGTANNEAEQQATQERLRGEAINAAKSLMHMAPACAKTGHFARAVRSLDEAQALLIEHLDGLNLAHELQALAAVYTEVGAHRAASSAEQEARIVRKQAEREPAQDAYTGPSA